MSPGSGSSSTRASRFDSSVAVYDGQTARHVEITDPAFIAKAFSGAFDAHIAAKQHGENPNLIG